MVLVLLWTGSQGQCAEPAIGDEHPQHPGYRLVWSDEFNGDSLDLKKWKYRTGGKMLSYQQPQNVAVHDGLLHIMLRKESAHGKPYTAGGVISRQRFEYGFYEARLRVPKGAGWHTSFWTMGYTKTQVREDGTKTGGGPAQEIDICEQDSVNGRSYSAGVIDWSGKHDRGSRGFGRVYYKGAKIPDFSADFHTFGCQSAPDKVRFYLDDRYTHGTDATKFGHGPQNIWLTCLAVLWGDPNKPKRVDDNALPAEAVFEYVRFYAKPTNDKSTPASEDQ